MNNYIGNMTDNNVVEYIRNLYINIPDDLYDLYLYACKSGVPVIKPESRRVLEFLLMIKKPANILEIGAGIGYSSIVMAKCCDAKITTIENFDFRIEECIKNIKKYNLNDRINLISGDAKLVLDELSKNNTFDFIFLDGPKAQYINWLPLLKKMLNNDGILLSDNILQEGKTAYNAYSMRSRDRTIHKRLNEFLKEVISDEDFHTSILSVGDGLSITYRKRK